MAVNRNVLIASVAFLLDEEEREKTQPNRSVWTRTWLQRRKIKEAFHTTFTELKEEDPEGFKGYVM